VENPKHPEREKRFPRRAGRNAAEETSIMDQGKQLITRVQVRALMDKFILMI
jgi:hypothetical protein